MLTMPKDRQQTICADIFTGKRVLVIGLGKTGLSCVRFLAQRGVDVAVTDTREKPAELENLRSQYPDVAVFVGGLSQEAIDSADILLVSPGLSINTPQIASASASGKPVIGDIELFAQCTTKPVIAITGSNGKSTVTQLVGEMARISKRQVAVGGNIGVPVLDLVEQDDEFDLYVLELSSFQLETTHTLNPVAAVVLNVSEDHMDRYASYDEYAQAKRRIHQGDGIIIQNLDETYLETLLADVDNDRKRIRFSIDPQNTQRDFGVAMLDGQAWLAKDDNPLIPVDSLAIKGLHNVSNALAALALGAAVGLPMPAMLEALQQFTGLPHRTQWVVEIEGVNWFNDSKATNVGATIAAVKGLSNYRLILIMGGQGKNQDFSALADVFADRVQHVFLLGVDAEQIARVLGHHIAHTHVDSMQQAVKQAHEMVRPGDAVLLSPACASFDMFDGYEHRGRVFCDAVQELIS
mgnify:CR=1 FL=1